MSLRDFPARDYGPAVAGADYGEVFLEETTWASVRLEDGRVRDAGAGSDRGLGLRLLTRRGERVDTLMASGPDLTPAAAARLRAELPVPAGLAPTFRSPQWRPAGPLIDPSQASLERKVEVLRRLDAEARAQFPGLRQATISYGDRVKRTRVVHNEGADLAQETVSTLVRVSVVAERDGRLQTAVETVGAQRGFELAESDECRAAARRAAARAREKLDAPKARAGRMPVVLAASAGGTFIHEAIGHSLEADAVQEGSSPAYRGARGRVVAPEFVTVIDDPTLPFQRGSFHFDDEGVPAAPTTLVGAGVLSDFLHDRVSALREGCPANGHGRRESFDERPLPRMSNLYVAPGPDDPVAIVRGLKRGLLVTRMGGGQVNTATGEFVFEVDEGYFVEDGRVRHPVRDANLLGVGPEVLRSIAALGWDIGWGIGTCGKEGQNVAVSDGQPTMLLPDIVVGGRHDD